MANRSQAPLQPFEREHARLASYFRDVASQHLVVAVLVEYAVQIGVQYLMLGIARHIAREQLLHPLAKPFQFELGETSHFVKDGGLVETRKCLFAKIP